MSSAGSPEACAIRFLGPGWHGLQACFSPFGATSAPRRRTYPCSAMIRFLAIHRLPSANSIVRRTVFF